ncbi:hypothetical protein [Frankia sp. Cj3]|uniref:hypothetical protein n=1 Tax=Frankia sp. Cj3 TaxID=2880976 RepID=UPI001EF3DCB4|nr:hypothetical protein [Frankia sp. Cj3]
MGLEGTKSAQDLVRSVIARYAPQELPYLDRVTRLCAENPDVMYISPKRRTEPLADGGLMAALVIVTPILYAALNDLAKDSVTGGVHALWQRIRRAKRKAADLDPQAPLGTFSPEQILLAKATMIRRLLQEGQSAEQSEALAEEFVAQLEDSVDRL